MVFQMATNIALQAAWGWQNVHSTFVRGNVFHLFLHMRTRDQQLLLHFFCGSQTEWRL